MRRITQCRCRLLASFFMSVHSVVMTGLYIPFSYLLLYLYDDRARRVSCLV